MLAARTCAVDRAGPAFGPRRAARTWEESITGIQWEHLPQELGFGSGMTCWRRLAAWNEAGLWDQLHLVLLKKPRSADGLDWSWAVCSTDKIPHSACRSGTRGRPETSFGPGTGSNGSISDHSSSDTINGRGCRFPATTPTSRQPDSHMINNFCQAINSWHPAVPAIL